MKQYSNEYNNDYQYGNEASSLSLQLSHVVGQTCVVDGVECEVHITIKIVNVAILNILPVKNEK